MCILFWTVDNHPKYRFLFASNRDEFKKRPTTRAHFWESPHQHILAGTDLEVHLTDPSLKNGTWLGITRSGRFSALTNFREQQKHQSSLSRGLLVRDYLQSDNDINATIDNLQQQSQLYNGFNLVCFDFSQPSTAMAYMTNRKDQPSLHLKPKEIYGLSNSILTEPWPKVEEGKAKLADILHHQEESSLIQALFDLLSTTEPMTNTEDANQILRDLQTRIYIPQFDWPEYLGLKEPTYGTRTSNVILIDYGNHVTFIERSWLDQGAFDDIRFQFDIK
ncbi:NRDE protein-domain-containing protein [Choanephora cucurbitarum]|nr:NRDE protein-domain-containing protein [Choanephora cucurbitarum]